ncbi:hypothetical protein GLOIN_2v1489479 [Rhizophagus clarus]|uniref:Uncharacterized protein n=1 Tax=Rhizophagus clarus TaxID=94130 RepID=A0A8H3L1A8_9GLOM|nr:hypothetical protein GLOIN_2v1489479 [Rhizophagus clarus]
MSTQIQIAEAVDMQITQSIPAKLTSQEVEQAVINVVKAGLYYRRPKEGKFMQSYKERIRKLCQAEDPEEYVLKLAQTIFSNKDKYNKIMSEYKDWYGKDPEILNTIMELYKLYYKLAKEYFNTKAQADEELEDFLSSI